MVIDKIVDLVLDGKRVPLPKNFEAQKYLAHAASARLRKEYIIDDTFYPHVSNWFLYLMDEYQSDLEVTSAVYLMSTTYQVFANPDRMTPGVFETFYRTYGDYAWCAPRAKPLIWNIYDN